MKYTPPASPFGGRHLTELTQLEEEEEEEKRAPLLRCMYGEELWGLCYPSFLPSSLLRLLPQTPAARRLTCDVYKQGDWENQTH